MVDKTNLLAALVANLQKQKDAAAAPNDITKKLAASDAANALSLTSTVAAAEGAFWAGSTAPTGTYFGSFAARGNTISTSGTSWANLPPDKEIATSQVNTLDLKTTLGLAAQFDGDIDGLASVGNSTIKEGEERFVFGASYLGTRGVSITEVSGALGSFVHGKRVNWTDGDIWVRQIGNMYKTDLETDFFDYQLTAKNIVIDRSSKTIKLQTKASDSFFVTNATDGLSETRTSAGRLHNFAFSKASASVTATSAAFSLAAAVVQTSTAICAATNMAFTISPFIVAYNLGLFRLAIDSTIVTAQISQNSFFNVARNSVSAYETLTEKMNLKVSAADIEAKTTLGQLHKMTSSVVEVGASFYRAQTRVSQLELENQKARMSTSKIGIAIEDSEAKLEKHKAQVIQNAFTTWA